MAQTNQQFIHLRSPAHVGLQPNEDVDSAAKMYRSIFPTHVQQPKCIVLSFRPTSSNNMPFITPLSKQFSKKAEIHRFQWQVTWDTQHNGVRYQICGFNRSHFHHRAPLPHSLQTLYSRWRLGQVESCGTYPRKLKWVEQPGCHLCSFPCVTTFHLLTDCAGTTQLVPVPAKVSPSTHYVTMHPATSLLLPDLTPSSEVFSLMQARHLKQTSF